MQWSKLELVGRGQTAEVYAWGKHEVLKLFYRSEEAEHEYRNALLVGELNVRCPRVAELRTYGDRRGIVYERIDGPTMLERIEPEEASLERNAILMAELQAELHQLACPYPSNMREELRRRLEWAEPLSAQGKREIQRLLDEMPDGSRLCHFDLHPGNIMLSKNGPVLIDWNNALVGDPAADAARTAMMLNSTSMPPDAPEWVRNMEKRKRFHDLYLAEYQRISGAAVHDIEAWMAPNLAVRLTELGGAERDEIARKLRERGIV